MAVEMTRQHYDDLAYRDGQRVEADETIEFSLDGSHYRIDLSAHNAERLRKLLDEFIAAATPTSQRAKRTTRDERQRNADIRKWAKGKKYHLQPRGRIPKEIRAAYEQENPT